MVRNTEGRVQDPADKVVYYFIVGEGLMTTFVGNDPQARGKKAGCKAVQRPDSKTGERVAWREEGVCVYCRLVDAGDDDEIPNDIAQRPEDRTLEAVCRNSAEQVFDGQVRYYKRILVYDGDRLWRH
jgi:hypothetical protein